MWYGVLTEIHQEERDVTTTSSDEPVTSMWENTLEPREAQETLHLPLQKTTPEKDESPKLPIYALEVGLKAANCETTKAIEPQGRYLLESDRNRLLRTASAVH